MDVERTYNIINVMLQKKTIRKPQSSAGSTTSDF